jgi:hypothetical protein
MLEPDPTQDGGTDQKAVEALITDEKIGTVPSPPF